MSDGAQDDGQEKTLDPTPQKLKQAREKGDIPKSNDINAAAMYLGIVAVLAIGGGMIGQGLGAPLAAMLARPHDFSQALLHSGHGSMFAQLASAIGLAVAPLFLVPVLFVLIALMGQQAFVIAPSKLEPKLSKISPLANAKQKFGMTGLMEFFKSFVKLLAIAVVLGVIVSSISDELPMMMRLDIRAMPALLVEHGSALLYATTGVAISIGLLDLLWQHHTHRQKLRMSLQEMKDETKQSEGDPHMKGQRMQRGREIASNRMMIEVPEADVVMVNPTHYAVALKWDRKRGSAPRCVAKGVDEIALKIREIAEANQVPIHRDVATTRALHATVEIDEEIRPDHYQAVAAAIRFADEMRKKKQRR
ncbi:MAG: flagellar type III secretion system protein FlhB [Neomegalonema sp.]|nr:flagellar type III secretion system protein FlhB [Neomegalonema sp.]